MEVVKVKNSFALLYDDYRADLCKFKSDLLVIIAMKETPEFKEAHRALISQVMSEPGLIAVPTDDILKLFFEVGGKIEDLNLLK